MIAVVVASASRAGVSTRCCARIVPSSSTTPPATLVPPTSTPIVRLMGGRRAGGWLSSARIAAPTADTASARCSYTSGLTSESTRRTRQIGQPRHSGGRVVLGRRLGPDVTAASREDWEASHRWATSTSFAASSAIEPCGGVPPYDRAFSGIGPSPRPAS